MLPDLQSRWDRLENLRHEMEGVLQNWSPEQLHFRPAPDKWSALQVLEHIVLSEFYTHRYMEKKRQASPDLRAPWYSGLLTGLLKLWLASPLKAQIPSQAVAPGRFDNLDQILEHWQGVRANLQQVLETFTPAQRRFPAYKHPFVGYQTPAQTLDFLYGHCRRHWRQILQRRQAPGFPGG
ncbi:MAG: DinB family protein [Calditrichaeota bacterium]|nr:MAG: DinB family protein [Calditrichota bacterium]